ncbi:FtsX-like permease family protein [Roseiconus nitratireducens]|uniref:FtsX-like permease family protein n=1 Tax=Roseiconus nitratireducens TaxID=2605748 RepID=A0A5M6D7C7_9BACT|nr:FtsX-like permease family protein [Roseiconus nitratireducens]KAA5542182.1 FtsX-like permease family protein [Roseiconus nitratireducens]
MWLLRIAWRNFCYRSLSSILTTVSLALGVALVVMVLAVFGIVQEAFSRNAQVGYNLVVGPKGSALQLTLNSVYYLSQPIENLPYTEYMEFFNASERAAMVRKYGGDPKLGERDGKYAAYVSGGYAIPLALGDYLGEYRVVGTTPEFFEKLRHGPTLEEPFEFRSGRAFQAHSEENGYFEAVLGFRVARRMNLQVGETFSSTHGDPEGKGHGQGFTVVGILAPTGTPNDRAAFVNLEGFYLLENHAKPLTGEEDIVPPTDAPEDANGWTPISIPEREVTSILVRNGNPMFGPGMQNQINESVLAQAAAPVGEINKLMNAIIGPMLAALLVITLITCIVAAVGVLVAIYNSMNDRRRDIAVMRALGARRETVTGVILLESLLIAGIGAVAGWFLAHAAIWFFSEEIENRTGVQVGILTTSSYEGYIFPLVLILALVAGFLPAWSAYRTDVGSNLSA